MRGLRGFTLVELMVVIAIAGVLLALSVPLGRYINNNATTSQLHEFASALNFSRNTAITSGGEVVICRLAEMNDEGGNPSGDMDCLRSDNSCGSTTTDNSDVPWHVGWAIFIDRDGDCSITNGTLGDATDDDPILQIHAPFPAGYTLMSGAREDIRFDNKGLPMGSQNTWTLCDPTHDPELAKAVILSPVGRIRFAEDSNNDGIREDADGNPLTCPG